MMVIPTVGVLICKGDKALLVKHGEAASHEIGVYGWPGGRLDPGETLKAAAVRELFEETGLITTEDDLEESNLDLGIVSIKRKNGEVLQFSGMLFLCKKYSGELHGSDETIPEWVAIEDLDNYLLLPNVKRAFTECFRNTKVIE